MIGRNALMGVVQEDAVRLMNAVIVGNINY